MMHDACEILGDGRPGPFLIVCDHASNHVPDWIGGGTLGLPDAEMRRHIAWDIGARGVSERLGALLDAPVVAGRFSRLAIDPNRGEDDPTLIMQVYDGTIVPGNRGLDPAAREERLNRLYRPFHAAVAEMAARRRDTILVTVHSYTPQLIGRPVRPWHVGVLFDPRDERLSRPLLDRLHAEGDIVTGENQPYAGHLPGDTVDRHGLGPGRPNALIELRHDLIATPETQVAWAERLAPLLDAARRAADL